MMSKVKTRQAVAIYLHYFFFFKNKKLFSTNSTNTARDNKEVSLKSKDCHQQISSSIFNNSNGFFFFDTLKKEEERKQSTIRAESKKREWELKKVEGVGAPHFGAMAAVFSSPRGMEVKNRSSCTATATATEEQYTTIILNNTDKIFSRI